MPNHNLVNRRIQRRNRILSRLIGSIPSNVLPERRTITIGQAEYEVPSDMRNSNAILNTTHFQSRNHERRDTFFHQPLHQPRMPRDFSHDIGTTVATQQFIDQTIFDSVPRPPVQMPELGQNAKTLSELANFDITGIPEEFFCSLSQEIMDDPVYDPAHPQYKFERQWIERSLQNKAENPYTRTPLSKTQLIPDTQLKNKIDDYMRRVTGQNTFCGL